MDKILLCRLCLTNSGNTRFVSSSPEIETLLQKYNLLFEVSSFYQTVNIMIINIKCRFEFSEA